MHISDAYKYAGFISYAHANEAIAARLHKALETYPIPRSLLLQTGLDQSRNKLSPIFRDATELTAHHSLSEKIRDAVETSRFLIVICSPAAKASHWVNEEIRLFRALHGEGSILCVLAEGTPETSFPPALLEDGREPLAANLGSNKDSFKLGTTQLAASMLGVGLDVLIQRETKRRRRRQTLITASALIFSGVMGTMTLTALDARNQAQESRSQAEGLVEYMITDLKDKLEPLGKLDILDSVGDKAVEYYDRQDIAKLSDESLTRQAKARHILGQVALTEGNHDKAQSEIEAAAALTAEVYKRNPENVDAIFAHAQSEFWVGKMHYQKGELDRTRENWENYAALGKILYDENPNNFDWIMERAWGLNNMGLVNRLSGDFEIAQDYYLDAIPYFETALKLSPDSHLAKKELANAIAGVSITSYENEDFKSAKKFKKKEMELLSDTLQSRPQDINLQYRYHRARFLTYLLTVQSDPRTCDIDQATTHLDTVKSFLVHDKSNYNWQYDYIVNWYRHLTACPQIYPKQNYNRQIKNLLAQADEFLTPESLAKERTHIETLLSE